MTWPSARHVGEVIDMSSTASPRRRRGGASRRSRKLWDQTTARNLKQPKHWRERGRDIKAAMTTIAATAPRLSRLVLPKSPAQAASFSLRDGPNFLVVAVHRVVSAKLATDEFDCFVLSGKFSHRPATCAQDAPRSHH